MDNRESVATFMKSNPHKLQEGETLCDKCNGTGCISSELNPNGLASCCSKCQGDGYVDWISNITGKPPKHIYGSSSVSMSSTSGFNIPSFIADQMAQDLADKIDKEILKTVITEAKPKLNQKEIFL